MSCSELLEAVEPDAHLATTLLSLNQVMPTETRDTAAPPSAGSSMTSKRKLATPMRQAITGS
jgi:hypothetical protein